MGTPATGYGFEFTLGFAALDPGPNEQMLYSCDAGGDHFVSQNAGCEGQTVLGPLGEVYTQPPSTGLQVVGLYRCTVNGSGNHFVSTDPACEGQHTEGLLGYATASQDRFNRYTVNGKHVDTARSAPANASFEGTLGFVLANGGPGLRALYSCASAAGQFTSLDPGCEGQSVLGLEGWIYDSSSNGWPPTNAIYRCLVPASGDHFDSVDPNCEGQKPEGLLGYIAQTHAALDRFVNPSLGDHWVTTRGVGNGYQFEGRLGYLLQQGGTGRHPLYSCVIGADHFMSRDAGCEGQGVIGQDGWAYDSPPSGQQVTAIYRCTVNGSGDHFVSTDPACEGQHTESLLGYIPSTPSGANVPPPPTNSSPPAITGNAEWGRTLTETHGAWTESPTSWRYQWSSCDGSANACQAIAGATSQVYEIRGADQGHTIRVSEWATNAGGTGGPSTSSATAVVTTGSRGKRGGGTNPGAACVVPRLKHKTLLQAKRALRRAHCRLGEVHRPKHTPRDHVLHVSKQSSRARTKHGANYRINITLSPNH